MECKVSELVRLGHDKAAQFKSSGGAVSQLISDLATQLDVQLSRGNALAAENAGLKNAITAVRKTSEECEINGDELKYVIEPSEFDALTDLLDETPETDAFLAEVRAQGVESAINTVIAMMNHQHPVTSKAIEILRVHAYQLRKGVQS